LTISAEQLLGWHEYYLAEPFGDDWRQTAVLACLSARKGGWKNAKIEDFLPIRQKQTRTEIAEKVNLFFQVLSAKAGNSNG